ncbi:MAG: hypothetical protein IJV48_05185 [Ruminococcus sp.]|nr:hypothetical protein [Ruminococcus sp.]
MLNVLFCGNDGVFDGFLTCALSMMKRTASDEPFSFHIFTMSLTRLNPKFTPLSEEHIGLFDRAIKRYHPANTVTVTDVTQLYERELGDCPNEGAYCSPYTLIRLLADLADDIPDKLLYLDADILFNRDPHLLYDIDISDAEYAASRDHYGKYLLYPNYVNAGVLLFNMQKCRETGLFKKARAELGRKKFLFADQTALIHATSKKKMLPQRYNDQKFLHEHTVVRHFSKRLFWLPYPHTENIKQWQVDKVHNTFRYHQFDDVLGEYLELKKQES